MTRPLNILLVSRSFPAHRLGGMEQHAQDVLDGLIEAGHTVHLATTCLPRKKSSVPLKTNGTITTLGSKCGEYNVSFFRELRTAMRILARKHHIDVIHAQGFAGITLASAHGLPPVLTTIHGTLWSETPLDRRIRPMRTSRERLRDLWKFKHRLAFWPVWNWFLGLRPRLIVDSQFTALELRRSHPQLRPHVAPLGIDTRRFIAAKTRTFDANHGCLDGEKTSPSPPLLFATGRLEPIKGFEHLIRVLDELPANFACNLVIGGDGPARSDLEKLAKGLRPPKRVFFTGKIPAEELADWYASADVFLNPDQAHPAFGLANAEALLCGTPVITTPNGAHPEVVRRGDGVLLPAQDYKGWASAICQLIDSPDRTKRRERAQKRFARQRMITRLERAYYRAVNEK